MCKSRDVLCIGVICHAAAPLAKAAMMHAGLEWLGTRVLEALTQDVGQHDKCSE